MLGDLSLRWVTPGSSIDLVVQVLSSDLHGASLRAIWNNETCRCAGTFLPDQVCTLYGVVFEGQFGNMYHLRCTAQTLVIIRPQLSPQSFRLVKDVYAGIGGLSVGLQQLGGHCLVALDHCSLACEALRLNHFHTMHSDLCDRDARIALHQQNPDIRSMVCAGLPCLGSSSGLGPGSKDPLAALFPVLQFAWHSQSSCIVLEGATGLQSNGKVLQCLHSFAETAGFQMQHVVLDLAQHWAATRPRWWAVFLPSDMPFRLASLASPSPGR